MKQKQKHFAMNKLIFKFQITKVNSKNAAEFRFLWRNAKNGERVALMPLKLYIESVKSVKRWREKKKPYLLQNALIPNN